MKAPPTISKDLMAPKAKCYPCYTRQGIEIPANSSVFVPVTTHGTLPMRQVWGVDHMIEATEAGVWCMENEVMVMPTVVRAIEGAVHSLLVNNSMKRIKVPAGTRLGSISPLDQC